MNMVARDDRSIRAPADALPPATIWGPAAGVIALVLAIMLGVLFRQEVMAAVTIWDTSTAYNHCWLVLPVAVWLGWTRRHRLLGLAPAPLPAAALLAIPPVCAWFLAERLGIMEGRQLALIGMIWVVFLTVLGWRAARALAAPLAYLIFLVPFGEFLTPKLQDVTAWIVDALLDVAGIPHFVDHLIIEIPEGTFLVAEACAGLRFLIAAIAFGALYAVVMFRSPGRRLIVLCLSILVPIIANGFRAFGIVLLGHLLGSAEAGAADHVIYGWVFFSFVILLLILAGLPFREDMDEEAPTAAAPMASTYHGRPLALLLSGALVTLVAGTGPALSHVLQGGEHAAASSPLALRPPAGCVTEGAGLRCGPEGAATLVSARMVEFSPRVSWAAIGSTRLQALGAVDEDDTSFSLGAPGEAQWRLHLRHDPAAPRAVGIAAWLGGTPVAGGIRTRVDQALNSLRGDGAARPVMVVIEAVAAPGAAAPQEPGSRRQGDLLTAILTDQGTALSAEAAARSSSARR